MEENKTIDEVIADAMAEEEVAKDFKSNLKNEVAQAFGTQKTEQTVTISLEEYLLLKSKEMDLERLLGAVFDDLKLSYNEKGLDISDGANIVATFKVLYGQLYNIIYQDLLKEAHEKEGE